MFEIIAKIIELLLNGSQRFQERQRQERRREFGTALLDCYLRLLEVLTTGEEIIRELEYFTERCRRYRKNGKAFSHGTFNIQMLCNKQGINLIRLSATISRIAVQIDVFAPETGEQLARLVEGKKHALWRLANLVGLGFYYIGPETQISDNRYERYTAGHGLYERMKEQSLVLTDEWAESMYDAVDGYLRERRPSEQLAALRKCAMELRAIIVSNLSLDEILWTTENFSDSNELVFNEDVERAKFFYEALSDRKHPPK